MKALSLTQPWAWLVAEGIKTMETRKWGTTYTGDLLICSTKKLDHGILRGLKAGGWSYQGHALPPAPYPWPLGYALAVVRLELCREMLETDQPAACIPVYRKAQAWVLTSLRKIEPFKVSGQLGLFDLELEPGQLKVIP